MPRVERMTLMKWMQVFRRRGRADDFVRSLTSTVEILPTTLCPLSTTARDETPSLSSRVSASVRGLSPLVFCQYAWVPRCERSSYLIDTTSFDPIFRSRRYCEY